MSTYDRMFNVVKHLEGRAIESATEIEADCLIEICNAIESWIGLVDRELGL
jgi:hypothetical protein